MNVLKFTHKVRLLQALIVLNLNNRRPLWIYKMASGSTKSKEELPCVLLKQAKVMMMVHLLNSWQWLTQQRRLTRFKNSKISKLLHS